MVTEVARSARADLVEAVYKRVGLPRAEAARLVELESASSVHRALR